MGTSTDAILALGIPLADDPGFEPYEEELDHPQHGPGWLSFMGGSEDGVEIIVHCCDGSEMYFVAVADSETRASRGYPNNIDSAMKEFPDGERAVKDFIKKYELNTGGDFGWHIMSWWG